MNAYVYNAALYCEACAAQITSELPLNNDDDLKERPQGPYPDGGGEADAPQHCDACNVFLQNPLTSDGYLYVGELMRDYREDGNGNGAIVAQWRDFYGED